MATRRMFSKTITSSSRFLMMPQSTQNLYFHLGMNADDDGFCEHFTIMRMTESKPDDLKILQAKGFVHVFDDRVLVILDWKENNYLRSDRYTPSKYLEIYTAELKAISEGCTACQPYGIPTGDTGKVRLGKDSIGKDNTLTGAPVEIEEHPEEVIALTNRFYSQMQKPTKYINKPPDLTKWYKPIHDLHKLDKIDYSLIEKVIDFATTDPFWKTVIQSTGKLREKFSQLEIKMNMRPTPKNAPRPAFDYEKQLEENERLFGGK